MELIKDLTGKGPAGYVAPWWEFSNVTDKLLKKYGIKYDHSLMRHDCLPYYVCIGDSWDKIDYSKPASTWMHPLKRGSQIVFSCATWSRNASCARSRRSRA